MAEQVINTPEALSEYEQGWTDMMMDIWHEQMRQLGCVDTGALYGSLKGQLTPGENAQIQHSFYMYGMYVANGVGYGYEKGNGGDLPFLGAEYRREHGLDKPKRVGPAWGGHMTSGNPRKERRWFDKKYWYSRVRLNETLQEYYGERGTYLIVQALEATFGENKAS